MWMPLYSTQMVCIRGPCIPVVMFFDPGPYRTVETVRDLDPYTTIVMVYDR